MIKLTRLDNEPFILNADLIRYIEARPDTYITLVSGERLVVRETMDEVVALSYSLSAGQASHSASGRIGAAGLLTSSNLTRDVVSWTLPVSLACWRPAP